MDIIDNFDSNKKEIMNYIEKYGFSREHNYWFFYNQQSNYAKIFFFRHKDAGLFLIKYKSRIWEIIGDVMGKEERRLELFKNILDYILLTKKDKKVFVFVPEKSYRDINIFLQKSNKYRITKEPLIYFTPVFNMKKWDDNLVGSKWKKLRNVKNKFLKSYSVEFVPSKEIDKEKLNQVVLKWKKGRSKIEKNYYVQMYLNFIKNNFEGTDIARSVVVDGKPCTITCGWKIPNSKNYYSAIGLYNYKYKGLGELANIDDLIWIKKKNFLLADFGDSTESLLHFKKKFNPERIYRTYWFHIVKK